MAGAGVEGLGRQAVERSAPGTRSLTLDRPRFSSVPHGAIACLCGHILWSHSFAPLDPFWAWAKTSPPDHSLTQLHESVLRSLLLWVLVMHDHGYFSLFESPANPGAHVFSPQIEFPCHADRAPAMVATGTPLYPESCLVVSSTHPQLCSSRCAMHRCDFHLLHLTVIALEKKASFSP